MLKRFLFVPLVIASLVGATQDTWTSDPRANTYKVPGDVIAAVLSAAGTSTLEPHEIVAVNANGSKYRVTFLASGRTTEAGVLDQNTFDKLASSGQSFKFSGFAVRAFGVVADYAQTHWSGSVPYAPTNYVFGMYQKGESYVLYLLPVRRPDTQPSLGCGNGYVRERGYKLDPSTMKVVELKFPC